MNFLQKFILKHKLNDQTIMQLRQKLALVKEELKTKLLKKYPTKFNQILDNFDYFTQLNSKDYLFATYIDNKVKTFTNDSIINWVLDEYLDTIELDPNKTKAQVKLEHRKYFNRGLWYFIYTDAQNRDLLLFFGKFKEKHQLYFNEELVTFDEVLHMDQKYELYYFIILTLRVFEKDLNTIKKDDDALKTIFYTLELYKQYQNKKI